MFSLKDKICIIGAGRFAFSFTSALAGSGYNVNCIISKTIERAEALAKKLSIKNFSNSLDEIPSDIMVYFLTVPDDKIESLSNQVLDLNLQFKDKLFIHTSGALDVTILNSFNNRKGLTGSFHIMQTFPSRDIISIIGSTSAIESKSPEVIDYLKSVSKDLGLNPLILSSHEKPLYHLAGVFASNFLTGNLFAAEELISKDKEFFKLFKKIIYTTLENIEQKGVYNSLSGPVARGDIETIKKHISVLSKEKDKALLLSYISQCLVLINLIDKDVEKHILIELENYLLKELIQIQRN